MKKLILSILYILPTLLFAASAQATVYTTTLNFEGAVVYSAVPELTFADEFGLGEDITDIVDVNAPYALVAGAFWDLQPDLPPFSQDAWWSLNYDVNAQGLLEYEYGALKVPVNIGEDGSIDLGSGSLADVFGTQENFDYLLAEIAGFITGGPYSDPETGILFFDTDPDLLSGLVLGALESGAAEELLSYFGPQANGLTWADIGFGGTIELVADTHSEVPEPATLALLSIGLLGFGIRRRLAR